MDWIQSIKKHRINIARHSGIANDHPDVARGCVNENSAIGKRCNANVVIQRQWPVFVCGHEYYRFSNTHENDKYPIVECESFGHNVASII